MKVYKGTILTVDAKDTVAKYLVEHRGRILFVGDELPEAYATEPLVDLCGKALIPAFADTHIHLASFATFHAGLNVMEARSNEEILQMLREHVKKTDEKLVIGFGASPYSVAEGKLVTRQQLDQVCPDKPLFLVKYDGHACVVNTKLLEKIRKKAQNLRGYHEESGEMIIQERITGTRLFMPVCRRKRASKSAKHMGFCFQYRVHLSTGRRNLMHTLKQSWADGAVG